MTMDRRQFLATSAAATILPSLGSAKYYEHNLVAEPIVTSLVPGYDFKTEMLGFNGCFPGPEIRTQVGRPLKVNVRNNLDEGTAVHWHGIRLPNAMDGVPMLTQDIQEPYTTKSYEFVPPDAGTYWYHSHYNSQEQVARGLIGPLIVEETSQIDVDEDITIILSDWLMNNDGQLIEEFSDMHSVAHAGFMGNYARAIFSKTKIHMGDRVRLRLINAATNRIFPLKLSGVDGKIVALDGMALDTPRDFADIIVAPAQRVDLIVDVSDKLIIDQLLRDGFFRLGELPIEGENLQRKVSPIEALPKSSKPKPSSPNKELELVMMGGAMGGAHGGDNIWSLNNVSDMPAQPWEKFDKNETVKIKLVNQTAFPHAMHLHGHHFYELNEDGKIGDFRDTTLVGARASQNILCCFDNPGNWMLHCHMLSHSMGGMKTWIKVG